MMKHWLALALVCAAALLLLALSVVQPANSATCTLVMGFSQTRSWFTPFEAAAGSASYESIATSGNVITRIADPSSTQWVDWRSGNVTSKCAASWQQPDQVMLNISGERGTDWVYWILAAVATIRAEMPWNPTILLSPVVGGPNHADCNTRASDNHPDIDVAIATVIGLDPTLQAGPSPEVQTCSQYSDDKGHLTSSGNTYVGQQIAAWFGGAPPTATPATPTSVPPSPTATPVKTVTGCTVRTTYSNGTTYTRIVALSVCQGLE